MTVSYYKIWFPVYEDGDDAAPPPAAAAADDSGDTDGGEVALPNVEFTPEQQEALNKVIAAEKRKHQKLTQKALDEAQAASKKAQLTAQERRELEQRLERLHDELLTKEELAKKNAERQRKTYEEQISLLASEKEAWQQRYTESTIQRSITDAAASQNAFSPKQIVAILGRDTRLIEVLDSQGKPTGKLEPRVRFSEVTEDGQQVTLDLSPTDAVKRMKEAEEYLNLFKGEGTGGAGMRSQPGGRKPSFRDLAKDPAAYREARKKGQISF